LNGWTSALVLSLTVVSAVTIGVFSAYWAVNGILYAFAHQSRPQTSAAVLVENHASGD
jgi:hypothetical protein